MHVRPRVTARACACLCAVAERNRHLGPDHANTVFERRVSGSTESSRKEAFVGERPRRSTHANGAYEMVLRVPASRIQTRGVAARL
eukprot:391047-Pleurochrysis_carterae.AAC.1